MLYCYCGPHGAPLLGMPFALKENSHWGQIMQKVSGVASFEGAHLG